MRRIISIVTVSLFIFVTLCGCSILQTLGLQKADDELRPVSSVVMGEDEADQLVDKVPIHLYFANDDNSKLKMEVRYISMADAKQSTGHLASVIVKELINGPTKQGLKATIPEGTKLRAVSVKSRVATVDLSAEFKSKHPGGKDAEKMTLFSIVNSLTELSDIQKVKFTIAGKQEKEFMGNYQFDAPFTRSVSLISMDVSEPAAVDVSKDSNAKPDTTKNAPQKDNAPKKDQKTPTKPASGDSQETSGGGDGSGDGLEMLE